MSPTDIWIVALEDQDIKEGFIKLWISYHPGIPQLPNEIAALTYEMKIYRLLTEHALDGGLSPHFIRLFSHTENCSYKDILDMVSGKYSSLVSREITPDEANYVLVRNLTYLENDMKTMIKPELGRKFATYRSRIHNVNSKGENARMAKDVAERCNFSFILTEYVSDNISLHTVLVDINRDSSTPYTTNTWGIMLQVIQACLTMAKLEIAHNDLHSANVMVTDFPNGMFNYPDEGVSFTCDKFIRIFDFDRAYTPSLGKNAILDEYTHYSQDNEFIPNKDMLKICWYFHCVTKNASDKEKIIDCLVSDADTRQLLTDSYKLGPHFIYDSERWPREYYDRCNSPQEIFAKFAKLVKTDTVE